MLALLLLSGAFLLDELQFFLKLADFFGLIRERLGLAHAFGFLEIFDLIFGVAELLGQLLDRSSIGLVVFLEILAFFLERCLGLFQGF